MAPAVASPSNALRLGEGPTTPAAAAAGAAPVDTPAPTTTRRRKRILVVTHHLPWVAQASLPREPPGAAGGVGGGAGGTPTSTTTGAGTTPKYSSSPSSCAATARLSEWERISRFAHRPTPPHEGDDDKEDHTPFHTASRRLSDESSSTHSVSVGGKTPLPSQALTLPGCGGALDVGSGLDATSAAEGIVPWDAAPGLPRLQGGPNHASPTPTSASTAAAAAAVAAAAAAANNDPHRLGYSWDGILENGTPAEEYRGAPLPTVEDSTLALEGVGGQQLQPGSLEPQAAATGWAIGLGAEGAASTTADVPPDQWTWTFSRRSGHSALYSGIQALAIPSPSATKTQEACGQHASMASPATDLSEEAEVLHIGWLGQVFDPCNHVLSAPPPSVQATLARILQTKQCYPIFLEERAAERHYDGYCKTDLWPLLHYNLWSVSSGIHSTNNSENWESYVTVNRVFADCIISLYQPGDTIFFNDYHLLLVPSMLRAALPDAAIGFFLHTPFPSSELFRCLPRRKEILSGVLCSNLIGFQTYSYARHFISSCTRVLGCESTPAGVDFGGAVVSVGTFPIGIDIERVQQRRKTAPVLQKMADIRDLYVGKKIIIGRDKLDHIKGVEHKLNAFEKFLELYPEWENRVVLIQVTTPSQCDSTNLQAKVSELVSRINGSWGSLEFAPVHHYHHHLNQDEYFALLSVADVGLITSVRDGMNTTSHEYVVCQQENQGPLVLSEFTGTAGSLPSAILVNPWDYLGVASAINEALTLSPEDRATKHGQLNEFVHSNTASFWARSFVKQLSLAVSSENVSVETPPLDRAAILAAYGLSKRRLLLFDYDGTLTPIVKVPTDALPSPELLRALRTLTADPRNIVYVISGRDQLFLDTWLGDIPGLGLSAEHGCFLKPPRTGRWTCYTQDMEVAHGRWKEEVMEIFAYYSERTIGSFVEEKQASVTWHYRLADPEYGLFQAKECQNHLENAILSKLPVEILVGKKNLEVRPLSINKGGTVRRLIAGMHASSVMGVPVSASPVPSSVPIPAPGRLGAQGGGGARTTTTTVPVPTSPGSLYESGASGSNAAPLAHPAAGGLDFCFCVGDDRTDEDMFRVIRRSDLPESLYFTCTVGAGSKKTYAQWHLPSPADVIELLDQGFAPLSADLPPAVVEEGARNMGVGADRTGA